MTRALPVLVLSISVAACGGSSSPTGPAPVTATPAPTPPPSLVGGWSGTESIAVAIIGGPSGSCSSNLSWIINSESTAGLFSGTWQVTGGSCGTQAGTLSGTISTNGTVSDVTFSATLNPLVGCSRIVGDGKFTGVLSGASLFLQTSERVRCTAPPAPANADADRNLTISLARQ